MANYKTFKTWDGAYTSFEWSDNAIAGLSLTHVAFFLIMSALLSVVISPFFIFVTLYSIINDEDDGKFWASFIGFVFSVLICLDLHYHFILNVLYIFLFGEKRVLLFYVLNLSYIVTHLFLMIFGPSVYLNSREHKRDNNIIVSTLVVLIVSFLVLGVIYFDDDYYKKYYPRDGQKIENTNEEHQNSNN
jgi:hypothetical protein